MSRLLALICAAGLALAALPALAQDYVPVEKRFTAEQLRASGLDRLSAQQLEVLNGLLSRDQATQVEAVRREASSSAVRRGGDEREVVVSRLVGEFRGWSAGTRLQLANGQFWRVTDPAQFYVPKSRWVAEPAVTVTPGIVSGWYLQVEGQSVRAKVQRAD